jgi:hypothetical protein
MAKKLGVFVSSDKHLDKIISLCQAAKKKDVEVTIFFSHLGTLLTQSPKFGDPGQKWGVDRRMRSLRGLLAVYIEKDLNIYVKL